MVNHTLSPTSSAGHLTPNCAELSGTSDEARPVAARASHFPSLGLA
jgi:hypothetical protein